MINVVIWSGDNWILSRLAQSLVDGLPNARRLDITDNKAMNEPGSLNYYINDWALQKRSRNTDIAFFDHPKNHIENPNKVKPNHAIAMCPQYQKLLQRTGLTCDLVHVPVDVSLYKPVLKLGFVGRFKGKTDYGDRKGRDLLEQVKKLPYVRLQATMGTLAEEDMPEFILAQDFILVPSKVEGGPMCLKEALACGVSVIMPVDVGMGEMFVDGIIPYKNSDFESLKQVLDALYEVKMKRRRLVEKHTWEYWVEQHALIFDNYKIKPAGVFIEPRKEMPKAKVGVFTTAIGEYGEKIGAFSIPLMEQWAKNNEYKFTVFREQGRHKTPSWVRMEVLRHMKQEELEYGIYLDLDNIMDPNAGDLLEELPQTGWDIAAWNHGDKPGWNPQHGYDNIKRYCDFLGETVPAGYDGMQYVNAGVLVFASSCINKLQVPIEKETEFGCQDQEAINLAILKGSLIKTPLPKKWNYGHPDMKEIPVLFEKANVVHCHLPTLAPCVLKGRVELMQKVYASFENHRTKKYKSEGR